MKCLKIHLIILFSIISFFLYGQNLVEPYREVSYSLYELEVNDSIFLASIDSFIFAPKCSEIENRKFQYFIMKIVEVGGEFYSIMVEAYRDPVADINAIGYFAYKGYSFFIYGCNPYNIFRKMKRKKLFKYKTGGLLYVEDFPYWKFILSNRRLILEECDCW